MRTEADQLREAAAHHRAGRLPEAAAGYRAILARDPRQPDALYLLGVVAHQTGQNAQSPPLVPRDSRGEAGPRLLLEFAGARAGRPRRFGRRGGIHPQGHRGSAADPDYFLNLGNVRKRAAAQTRLPEAYQAALHIHRGAEARITVWAICAARRARWKEAALVCFERAVEAEPGAWRFAARTGDKR